MQKWRITRRFHITCEFAPELLRGLLDRQWSESRIPAMYDYYLPRIESGKIAKVILHFYDPASLLSHSSQPTILNDVLIAPVKFAFETYQNLSLEEQKLFLLETIHQPLLKIADEEGWPTAHFSEAYLSVKRANFVFAECWKKPIFNPQRTYSVQACWEWTTKIKLFLEVRILIRIAVC